MFETKKIQTFKEFHRLVPEILKRLNEDHDLAVRASANPLLAFREMGIVLSDDVAKEVEKFIRFTPAEQKRLENLEKELSKYTDRKIDFRSTKDVESFLTKDLKITEAVNLKVSGSPNVKQEAHTRLKEKQQLWKDPLEKLKDLHPAMKPLLEYRSIYYGKPAFASKSLYNDLKSGKRKLPVTGLKIKFPENIANHGEENHG